MSILSSISQKFSQYFDSYPSKNSSKNSSQNQKSSLNETLRQAGQQLHELVHQGNNDEYWNTAITGKIGGPCDIAQADNFQSTDPLANDLLKGMNTLSGAASFAVNTVSNTACGVVFDLPNAVEEKIVGMGGPSFDELFVSAQMTPGPPIDDALVYGLNRLAELGGELRNTASLKPLSRLSDELPGLTLEPPIRLKYDPVNKIWTSPVGIEYKVMKRGDNRIKHVLEHLKPNFDKKVHTVFKYDHPREILPLLDEAWMKRGTSVPGDHRAHIVEMGRVIGTQGETKIRIVVEPQTLEFFSAYPYPVE